MNFNLTKAYLSSPIFGSTVGRCALLALAPNGDRGRGWLASSEIWGWKCLISQGSAAARIFPPISYKHLFDFAGDTMASAAVYKFFRPELRDASYATGDVYSPLKVKQAQEEWDIYK